jgi:hypothetical protein
LPALIEADDDGMYVLKFRGAGQGQRVLVAELICGELGRALGLPIPEVVFVELDPALGRNEPDGEIQALIEASAGLNLALDFLPGALGFDPTVAREVDPDLAAAIVWFDAFLMNVDRTARNPNLLLWHRKLWLIDHGAALYLHHTWDNFRERSRGRFQVIRDHVLLGAAGDLQAADARLAGLITPALVQGILAQVPDQWLGDVAQFADIDAHRAAYAELILGRLAEPRAFVEEAVHARSQRV